MGIGGGIIGGILGGMFGGWWGAAIGAWIGASIGNSDKDQDKQPLETYCDIFRCLGQLAKCDGRVTQDEAELVSSLIKQLDIPQDSKSGMKQAFNPGKTQTVHDFSIFFCRNINDVFFVVLYIPACICSFLHSLKKKHFPHALPTVI